MQGHTAAASAVQFASPSTQGAYVEALVASKPLLDVSDVTLQYKTKQHLVGDRKSVV